MSDIDSESVFLVEYLRLRATMWRAHCIFSWIFATSSYDVARSL